MEGLIINKNKTSSMSFMVIVGLNYVKFYVKESMALS